MSGCSLLYLMRKYLHYWVILERIYKTLNLAATYRSH